MPDDPIGEIQTKENIKQIQVKESVWENVHEIRRHLEYRDHKDYTMSDTIYELIIEWNKNVGYTPTKAEEKEPVKKKGHK